jgi:hypothetical protein
MKEQIKMQPNYSIRTNIIPMDWISKVNHIKVYNYDISDIILMLSCNYEYEKENNSFIIGKWNVKYKNQ